MQQVIQTVTSICLIIISLVHILVHFELCFGSEKICLKKSLDMTAQLDDFYDYYSNSHDEEGGREHSDFAGV